MTICPYSLFVHFLVIPVTTAACMFALLINLQQFATPSMGSRGKSLNTATVDVVVPSRLVDGQTCHVNVGTIPDDHFDVD